MKSSKTHKLVSWPNQTLYKSDRSQVKRRITLRIPIWYPIESVEAKVPIFLQHMKEKKKAGLLYIRKETEEDMDRYARYIQRSIQMYINEEEAWIQRVSNECEIATKKT